MPNTLQFNSLRFKAGSFPGSQPLEIHPGSVVVLVGPNNSGKSAALKEIETWCVGGSLLNNKIIDNIEIEFPADLAAAELLLETIVTTPDTPEQNIPDHVYVRRPTVGRNGAVPSGIKISINKPELEQILTIAAGADALAASNASRNLRERFVSNFVIRLDGRTRFALTESKPAGNIAMTPQNHLWQLFVDDTSRTTARELTSQAFGLHLVIDPTAMRDFSIKMSPRAPIDIAEEKALDERARLFYSAATDIQETSDGVQAFTGLVTAMLSLPFKILLVDEPEAFLHPPLSRRLGNNMARLARDSAASIMVSTHSSEFLMGCLETVPETQIVRLTYEGGIATARSLSGVRIQSMMKNPLMRSTGTLQALFHKSAIVTESDTDRSFYDEINTRLLNVGRGVADNLFLNAQNKQTIFRVIGPLREIGIPAAGVYDLDLIRVGNDFTNLMQAAKIPAPLHQHMRDEKLWLLQIFEQVQVQNNLQQDPLKFGGINHLAAPDRTRAMTFLTELEQYGIFVVPIGEVEQWLSGLGITGKANQWLIPMFSALGEEGEAQYIHPAADDVWNFIDRINTWMANANRLGMA